MQHAAGGGASGASVGKLQPCSSQQLSNCPSAPLSCSCSIDPERRIVLKDGTVLYGDPSLRSTGRKRK